MNADEIKKANEPLEGNFEGVGIQFQIFQDTILVIHVISRRAFSESSEIKMATESFM